MRKLFVLFVLAALIPFTTGCRIDGLWGYDDDSGQYAVATTSTVKNTVNLSVAVPATAISKADIQAGATVVMDGVTLAPTLDSTGTDYVKDAAGNYVFSAVNVPVTNLTTQGATLASAGTANVPVTINVPGKLNNVTVTVPVSSKAPTTANVATNTVTLTYSTTTDPTTGKVTPTFTGTTVTSDPNAPTYTVPTVTATPTVQVTVSIQYNNNGTWTDLNNATNVPYMNFQMRAVFNVDVAKATDSFSVTAKGTTSTVSLTQADIPTYFTMTQSDSKTLVLGLVQNAKEGKSFKTKTTYSLTLNSSSLVKAGTTDLIPLSNYKVTFTTM